MVPGSPLGRQSGASWDSADCFRFLFAIGGLARSQRGVERCDPAAAGVDGQGERGRGRRDDVDAARQGLAWFETLG